MDFTFLSCLSGILLLELYFLRKDGEKMKKFAMLFLSVALIVLCAGAAWSAIQAKDALIAYVGTEAFTKLNAGERQACVEWLAEGGAMGPECKKAVMRLIALAPGAVTVEQRQALVLAASDSVASSPVSKADTPVIVEKKDDTAGAAIVGGLFGILAGLVIANNVGHHRHYAPAPPAPRPPAFARPPRGPFGGPGGRPKLPPHRAPVNVPKRPPKGGRPPHR